jgi:hypothetical protein
MADYKGVLADLKARRTAIEKECADLDTAIAAVERLANLSAFTASVAAAKQTLPDLRLGQATFSGLRMPQAITNYLTMVRQPQTTRQVIDALKSGGVKDSGSLRGHVYNTLHRLSQEGGPFKHNADGRWSLREDPAIELFAISGAGDRRF